jgi:hypothetical protein
MSLSRRKESSLLVDKRSIPTLFPVSRKKDQNARILSNHIESDTKYVVEDESLRSWDRLRRSKLKGDKAVRNQGLFEKAMLVKASALDILLSSHVTDTALLGVFKKEIEELKRLLSYDSIKLGFDKEHVSKVEYEKLRKELEETKSKLSTKEIKVTEGSSAEEVKKMMRKEMDGIESRYKNEIEAKQKEIADLTRKMTIQEKKIESFDEQFKEIEEDRDKFELENQKLREKIKKIEEHKLETTSKGSGSETESDGEEKKEDDDDEEEKEDEEEDDTEPKGVIPRLRRENRELKSYLKDAKQNYELALDSILNILEIYRPFAERAIPILSAPEEGEVLTTSKFNKFLDGLDELNNGMYNLMSDYDEEGDSEYVEWLHDYLLTETANGFDILRAIKEKTPIRYEGEEEDAEEEDEEYEEGKESKEESKPKAA